MSLSRNKSNKVSSCKKLRTNVLFFDITGYATTLLLENRRIVNSQQYITICLKKGKPTNDFTIATHSSHTSTERSQFLTGQNVKLMIFHTVLIWHLMTSFCSRKSKTNEVSSDFSRQKTRLMRSKTVLQPLTISLHITNFN